MKLRHFFAAFAAAAIRVAPAPASAPSAQGAANDNIVAFDDSFVANPD